MKLVETTPRPGWQQRAQEYGFHFHTMGGQTYWDESRYYEFSLAQIENDLESVTETLHQMCLDAVPHILNDERLLRQFAIPERYWDLLRYSWQAGELSLYSRFDFAYDGQSPAKLLEYNADTPTALYETGFWQWLWLDDLLSAKALPADTDQFNSVQEALIERLALIGETYQAEGLHFTCCGSSEEDRGTTQYLQDCAIDAGLKTKFVSIDDIGISHDGQFVDHDDFIVKHCFKLYPWEFMFAEEFGQHLAKPGQTIWIEPAWKALLSNKALLPLLWQLHPNHPNLLPSYFDTNVANQRSPSSLPIEVQQGAWIRKPIFSREGANIELWQNGKQTQKTEGPYGEEGFIWQKYQPLPTFSGRHALVGSWVVGDKSAGICIRDDASHITQDTSRFVPHIIRSE